MIAKGLSSVVNQHGIQDPKIAWKLSLQMAGWGL